MLAIIPTKYINRTKNKRIARVIAGMKLVVLCWSLGAGFYIVSNFYRSFLKLKNINRIERYLIKIWDLIYDGLSL